MANNLLTISMITNEALMVLENELTFTARVDRSYDDQFAVTGAKIGNTVNVRRPGRFIGTTGPALNVEDFNETSVPVTLSTQFHVDTQFTTQDLALSLDLFSSRVLKPAVAAVAHRASRRGACRPPRRRQRSSRLFCTGLHERWRRRHERYCAKLLIIAKLSL